MPVRLRQTDMILSLHLVSVDFKVEQYGNERPLVSEALREKMESIEKSSTNFSTPLERNESDGEDLADESWMDELEKELEDIDFQQPVSSATTLVDLDTKKKRKTRVNFKPFPLNC